MSVSYKRAFISSLPADFSEDDVRNLFTEFGEIISIEIKERKFLGPHNNTLFFAYINLDIDDLALQKCFQRIHNSEWKGHKIKVEVAKENFLDRLKREREQTITQNVAEPVIKFSKEIESKTNTIINFETNPIDFSSICKQDLIVGPETNISTDLDPSIPSECQGDINAKKRALDNEKRLKSLMDRKKLYEEQKQRVQRALMKINVDVKESSRSTENIGKKKLFDDVDGNEDYDIKIKPHFHGRKGRELMALQSNCKNDDRFRIDERFIEEARFQKNDDAELQELVKQRKKIPCLEMSRFDPTQSDNSLLNQDEKTGTNSNKKTKKQSKVDEAPAPVVSKETFFTVNEDLKASLESNSSFTFLANTEDVEKIQQNEQMVLLNGPRKVGQINPFKYDSSDGEAEESKNPDKSKLESTTFVSLGAGRLWTESLFFKTDDFRFQDGMEFVKKLGLDDIPDISNVRRDIKQIVRAKVKHNENKKKMFKKKLGGKRHKVIKFRKALKK